MLRCEEIVKGVQQKVYEIQQDIHFNRQSSEERVYRALINQENLIEWAPTSQIAFKWVSEITLK